MINTSQHLILILDSPLMGQISLANKLKIFGFNPIVASSVTQCQNLLSQNNKISTWIIPNPLDDQELLGFTKERFAKYQFTPAVFVAAKTSQVLELYDLGVSGFLSDPFETKMVLELVRKSTLSFAERLIHPSSLPSGKHISMYFKDISLWQDLPTLRVGRGGFSIKTAGEMISLGMQLSFSIQGSDGHFTGEALVRWIVPETGSNMVTLGLEWTHLKKESLDFCASHLRESKLISFIPKLLP